MTGIDRTPTTRISTSDERSITVRGHDLVNDIMGKRGFTEFLYFLVCHRFPTAGETRILDACLVTLMEHGLTPSAVVTRLVADSVPGEAQVAMAAGLLAVGSVFVGTMEGCGAILKRGIDQGGDLDAYCRDTVASFRAQKQPLPGFGHPIHRPDDPRPPRLFEIAAECGVKGVHIALLRKLSAELDRQAGRHLTINATGAIAALLLEIGIPVEIMRGIAVVSRAGGLTGHIIEERETHSGRYLWNLAERSIPYEGEARVSGD
jgi:citrate synthase